MLRMTPKAALRNAVVLLLLALAAASTVSQPATAFTGPAAQAAAAMTLPPVEGHSVAAK